MLYEIIITRHGVPHQTWEAEADTDVEAIDACRAARTATGEQSLFDLYDAVMATELDDDEALALALADASNRMPALLARAEATIANDVSLRVPSWCLARQHVSPESAASTDHV